MNPRDLHSFRKSLLEPEVYFFQLVGEDMVQVPVSEMETDHLYYTLRIIWHKYAPTDVRILRPEKMRNYTHLVAASLFCRDQAPDAIRYLIEELLSRDDLTSGQEWRIRIIQRSLQGAIEIWERRTGRGSEKSGRKQPESIQPESESSRS